MVSEGEVKVYRYEWGLRENESKPARESQDKAEIWESGFHIIVIALVISTVTVVLIIILMSLEVVQNSPNKI